MVEQIQPTFYDILGVETGASAEVITHAYRQVLKECEGDGLQKGGRSRSSADLSVYTRAYRTLTDANLRAEYDSLLGIETAPPRADVNADDEVSQGAAQPQRRGTGSLRGTRELKAAESLTGRVTVVYEELTAFSPLSEEEVPEEWKREREFFEEHFDEILKPAPRVDLVGAGDAQGAGQGATMALSDWDELKSGPASTRFGTPVEAHELAELRAMPASRRFVQPGTITDPFLFVAYFGVPVMVVLALVEFFLFLH
jgi:curved DNA-binding protein CbpA